jgi:hypothetical protein
VFQLLLPKCADNSYRGHPVALWILGLVAITKGLQGLTSLFNAYSTIKRADGIPVDTFPQAAASTVLALFALLGFLMFLIAALCLLALMRYRSLVPLMFSLLVLHYLGARLVVQIHPLARTGSPVGVYINMGLFALMLIGLVLSMWERESGRAITTSPNND